ncbi:MAG: hypothetical protein AAGB11_12170 [Pseudomonadota bacterium]
MGQPRALIGIVGYTPVLDVFPLGPHLMTAVEERVRDADVCVENMTWGPIHIVQRFQEPGAERFSRLVLIGAASTAPRPGAVRAFRWRGGKLAEADLQERVYEGITGVVDIENTLVIGDYFGVWPDETFTVEADLPADAFGRMVIADSEGWADDPALDAHLGFSPKKMREKLAEIAADLALLGSRSSVPLRDKSVETFTPVVPFIRNHTVLQSNAGESQ